MQNFVLVGKAKTVFRLIELKANKEKIEGRRISNGNCPKTQSKGLERMDFPAAR
jgi:hypothetical protein